MSDTDASGPSSGAKVAGVLLAAGGGRRFGMPKALIELDGETLATRGARTLASGGCDPVIVVVGASARDVQEQSVLGSAVVVANEQWAEGMGGSVRLGLGRALRSGALAVVMLPVDQPLVTAETIVRLVEAWRAGASSAVAATRGSARTPVLMDRSLFGAALESAVGDVGAGRFLRAHPELVTLVECDDAGELIDVDTPGDLETIEEMLECRRTS